MIWQPPERVKVHLHLSGCGQNVLNLGPFSDFEFQVALFRELYDVQLQLQVVKGID